MRIIGLDLGTKTLGIAITDSMKIIASGVANFEYENNDLNRCVSELKNLITKYQNDVESIVIGYPTKLNGDKSEMTFLVESFIELLKINFPTLKIIKWDERFSTKKATELLKYSAGLKSSKIKKIKDKMSAVYILQDYLENSF